MSKLTKKDFHFPPSSASAKKIAGHVLKGVSQQAAAASLAAAVLDRLGPATQDGPIASLYFFARAAAAAGESMTVDVLVNGVSILSGVYTYDATSAVKTQIDLMPLLTTVKDLKAGDVVTTTRVYTAGGGPTPMANNVVAMEVGAASPG